MIAGTLIGTLSPVVVIGPSVLTVFGASSTSTWPNLGIWSLVRVVGAGLILMLFARLVLRSAFFNIQRESDAPPR